MKQKPETRKPEIFRLTPIVTVRHWPRSYCSLAEEYGSGPEEEKREDEAIV